MHVRGIHGIVRTDTPETASRDSARLGSPQIDLGVHLDSCFRLPKVRPWENCHERFHPHPPNPYIPFCFNAGNDPNGTGLWPHMISWTPCEHWKQGRATRPPEPLPRRRRNPRLGEAVSPYHWDDGGNRTESHEADPSPVPFGTDSIDIRQSRFLLASASVDSATGSVKPR